MKNIVIVTLPRSGSTYFASQKAKQYKLNFFNDEMEPFTGYKFAPNKLAHNIEQFEKYNKHGHFFITKIFVDDYINVLGLHGVDLIDLLEPYTQKFYVLVRKNIQENYNSLVTSFQNGQFEHDRRPTMVKQPTSSLKTNFVPLNYVGLSHIYKNIIPSTKSELVFYEDFATVKDRYPNVGTCPEGWPTYKIGYKWVESLFL